ncbi:hypothetical protein Dimus_018102, partial [Dionaea muscipula]
NINERDKEGSDDFSAKTDDLRKRRIFDWSARAGGGGAREERPDDGEEQAARQGTRRGCRRRRGSRRLYDFGVWFGVYGFAWVVARRSSYGMHGLHYALFFWLWVFLFGGVQDVGLRFGRVYW